MNSEEIFSEVRSLNRYITLNRTVKETYMLVFVGVSGVLRVTS